jgi:hypothetical protein
MTASSRPEELMSIEDRYAFGGAVLMSLIAALYILVAGK